MRKRLLVAFFAVALCIAGIAGPSSAGLVNIHHIDIDVGGINFLNNTTVAVALNPVVLLCPNVGVNNVLNTLNLVAAGALEQETVCKGESGDVVVKQHR